MSKYKPYYPHWNSKEWQCPACGALLDLGEFKHEPPPPDERAYRPTECPGCTAQTGDGSLCASCAAKKADERAGEEPDRG